MALDLHVAGPGLDLVRRLAPGEPALILGRDSDCGVCLPDPDRNVSRRHLSVWNDGDQLHFHVLSVVNGVTGPAGELPPGARGVLAAGEALRLAAFSISASPVPEAAPASDADADADADPWAEFERQAAELAADAEPAAPAAQEDDPFGDWGFQSTFGPGSPGGALSADALAPADDLSPFFAGLGVAGAGGKPLTRGELETLGRLTRIALQGLLQVAQASAATRQQVRVEDRTMAERRELNPLRLEAPVETKLAYLFGGQAAAAGLLPPDRAVAQVVGELAAHQEAVAQALHEALLDVLAEFDPAAIKARLLGGGARLFESARAWEAFVREYAERHAQREDWVRQSLERHFARAYARALLRVKRDTAARRPG
jgi:predicted component of type VI protein secretion system